MTDEQINKVISKDVWFCSLAIRATLGFEVDHDESKIEVKNYAKDLNLMHEAEATLNEDQLWLMAREIERNEDEWYFRATARQRAEAFLRTLGKWEEGK
jgi:hypothetical protein